MRYDEFLPTTYFKKAHDVLIHYGSGRNVFEEKPVDYGVIGEIQKYQITFREHSNDYDFYNSESLVDDFLLNVKNRIKRSDNDFIIRYGFLLENIQTSSFGNEEPIASSQYWSTEPYKTRSFNGYIYFSLREGILKRVINNDMTGSSWHFHNFLYMNLKILDIKNQFFR